MTILVSGTPKLNELSEGNLLGTVCFPGNERQKHFFNAIGGHTVTHHKTRRETYYAAQMPPSVGVGTKARARLWVLARRHAIDVRPDTWSLSSPYAPLWPGNLR